MMLYITFGDITVVFTIIVVVFVIHTIQVGSKQGVTQDKERTDKLRAQHEKRLKQSNIQDKIWEDEYNEAKELGIKPTYSSPIYDEDEY